MTMLLHSAAKTHHAVSKGGRSCPCCCSFGATKSGAKVRQEARQQQRQIEKRQWKAEV